jgi:hypothetical protein
MTNAIWAIMFDIVRLQWWVAWFTLFSAGVEGVVFFLLQLGGAKNLIIVCLIFNRDFSGDKWLVVFFGGGWRGGRFLLQWCGTMYGLFFQGFFCCFCYPVTQVLYLYLVGGCSLQFVVFVLLFV